jgi:dTDP-4-dehydrorhamnose 3,5-epimerase-like enzyme
MLIKLKKIGDEKKGYLSFFESNKDIPFTIKRVYFIYNNSKKLKRGFHAHKKLKQTMWCPYGEIEITLDNGKTKKTYKLKSPNELLYVEEKQWREISWIKKDSVLCVAASEYFDEKDYIRDYNQFIKYIKGKKNEN